MSKQTLFRISLSVVVFDLTSRYVAVSLFYNSLSYDAVFQLQVTPWSWRISTVPQPSELSTPDIKPKVNSNSVNPAAELLSDESLLQTFRWSVASPARTWSACSRSWRVLVWWSRSCPMNSVNWWGRDYSSQITADMFYLHTKAHVGLIFWFQIATFPLITWLIMKYFDVLK